MESIQQQKFEQWCLVELFGHQRIAGWVTEATIGGCSFVRVDVPKADAEGENLYTRYFGNGAIYAINPTTKEAVMRIVGELHPRPPTPRALPIGATGYEFNGMDEPEIGEYDDD